MNPLSLDANSMRIWFNPYQEVVCKWIKCDYITIHDTRKVTPTMNLVGLSWLSLWRVFCATFSSALVSNVGEERAFVSEGREALYSTVN